MATESGQPATMGGSVEPANRAAIAKERFQAPLDAPGPRFELFDPFAEVTYRLRSFREIVAKAEQLGATRVFSVQQDGTRQQINKIDGSWQPVADPARATPSIEPEAARPTANVRPLPAPEKSTEVDIARIDADAERVARAERLQAALAERYVIKRATVQLGETPLGRTEYRYRGDTSRIAFTETPFRLSTDNNSPSVARSMVDVAEARNWQVLRVSGHEDFKRLVWLEASVRGVRSLGYEPQGADLELVKREREARQVNRIEPAAGAASLGVTPESKQSSRGGGSRKTVLAALEAVLVARRVPLKQREMVMAAATETLTRRLAAGETHRIKVFDKAAPSHQQRATPLPEQQRVRERASPTR